MKSKFLSTPNLSVKGIFSFLVFLSLFGTVFSQTGGYNITLTSTNTRINSSTAFPCPFQDVNLGSRAQYLYRAAELKAAGMDTGTIQSIAFDVTSLNTFFGTLENYTIKMGMTTSTALGATTWVAGTSVVYGPQNYTPTLGRNVITLTTPFSWDGNQNIVVEVCGGDALGVKTSNVSVKHMVTTYNSSRSFASDAGGNLCGSTSTTKVDSSQLIRPITTFNWLPNSYCAAMPVVGTVSASATFVCPTVPVTLTSNGGTRSSYILYQWQDSSVRTNGQWEATDLADVDLSITKYQDTIVAYRLQASCFITSDTAYSNVVTVTTPRVPGGHYVINKNHTGNVWPLSDTFKTFNATIAAMSCGIKSAVTYEVLPGSGPYNEQLLVNATVLNSSATNTITYKGNGETIQFLTTAANRAVIKLKATKYFIFDSLTVTPLAGAYGIGIQLMNSSDSNVITRCTINGNTSGAAYTNTASSAGIVVGGTDASAIGLGNSICRYNSITKNKIIGSASGFVLAGVNAGGENLYTTFANNTVKDFYAYGVYISGAYYTNIEHNIISRPTATLPVTGTVVGVYARGTEVGLTIQRNRIHTPFAQSTTFSGTYNGIHLDNADPGATPTSDQEFVIANNLIYNIQGNGIVNGILNAGTKNVQVYHNTISLDDDLSTATGATRGYSQTGTVSAITFANNLITINRGGSGTKHCNYVTSSNITNYKLLSNNNYLMDATAGSNYIGFWGANRATIGDWTTASTETNAYNVQPAYSVPFPPNMDTADYRPSNATIDDKATPIYANIDINGTTTSRKDIGCYEFIPPPCNPASLNGQTMLYAEGKKIISDSTVCENVLMSLKLKVTGSTGSLTTYQWQYTNNLSIAPVDFGAGMLSPDTTFYSTLYNPAQPDFYFRCKVSCGGTDYYSDWRKLTIYSSMITGNYIINLDLPTTYIPGYDNQTFHDYTSAVAAMKYCGVKGSGNYVRFNVQQALAGDYAEQIKIDSIKGVTATRRVMFKGNNTTIKFPVGAPNNTNERAVIKLERAHFITLDSIIVDATAAPAYAHGIQLLSNADSNTIINCTIKGNATTTTNTYAGIVIGANANAAITSQTVALSNCDSNLIANNIIDGNYYGIAIAGSGTNIQSFNSIINNDISNFYNTGIYIAGAANSLIEKNSISRTTRANVAIGYGINFAAAASNSILVSKNRIFNFFGGAPTNSSGCVGILFNSSSAANGTPNTVRNNAIYNLGGLGNIYGLQNTSSNNIAYLHNSISIEDTTVSTAQTAGLSVTTASTGLVFKNNIVAVNRGGINNKFCVNIANTGVIIDADYNDYYINTSKPYNYIGTWGTGAGGLRKLLSNWKAATSQEANSLDYEPLFVNTITGDLHPQFYLLDNKGVAGFATDDILNITRPLAPGTVPDMGAFEFNTPSCPSPLNAGTAIVTPNTGLCLEQPVHLSLSGNSPLGQINFQWQDAASAAGPWTNLGSLQYSPAYDTISSVKNYYRCVVTCATTGVQTFSTVAVLNLNNLLPAGTYTIDCNLPTDPKPHTPGDNFNSFADAVADLLCGITGPIVFDVKPCTFNEQVRIPYIPGTSAINTITFQGFNKNVGGAVLTFSPANAAANYVLQFDTTNNITFRDMIIQNTNTTNGRVVDFNNKSSNCNLLNNQISTVKTLSITNANAAIYANSFKGRNIVIKGNTTQNGSSGIYFNGIANATNNNPTIAGHIIDSNFVNNATTNGIHFEYNSGLTVTRNTVNFTKPLGAYSGIYSRFSDSACNISNNKINIDSSTFAVFGIQVLSSKNKISTGFLQLNGNEIYANTANTGKIIGLSIANCDSVMVKNNVISINSGGSGSYGLYNNNNATGTIIKYYNNSVQIALTDTFSTAAQFGQANVARVESFNNIFSNVGGGKAMYVVPANNIVSNYNMLYALPGKTLVQTGTTNASYHKGIVQWRKVAYKDRWSIYYKPSFVSNTDLHPDLNNSDVWAMHGRGLQISDNNFDINNNTRVIDRRYGVPDLGAYEFHPNAATLPTVLPSIPATPTANTIQTFYFGSDTVARITWGNSPPASIDVRRYSGDSGPAFSLQGNTDSMNFYVSANVPGNAAQVYNMRVYYIDPWKGNIPDSMLYKVGMGRTTPTNPLWVVDSISSSNVANREIVLPNISTVMDKYTAQINPPIEPPIKAPELSNEGKDFWVAYPRTAAFTAESYVLYLSSRDSATVRVDVDCEGIHEVYNLVPNVVTVSNIAFLGAKRTGAGKWCSGIHITSHPWGSGESDLVQTGPDIVAYTHCYGSATSGAGLLLPTPTWGYEYRALSVAPDYGSNFSYYYAIAKHDSTKVVMKNFIAVQAPNIANDTVILNRGEWYQVLSVGSGALPADDITGSTIKSIDNGTGKCYPIAVFSGVTRTAISDPCGGGGDFIMQQNFPSTAWGKRYLTAPTSASTGATQLQGNLFRISLKDPTRDVRICGAINGGKVFPPSATTLNNTQLNAMGIYNFTYNATGQYIEYVANTGSATSSAATTNNAYYIESDTVIAIAQYLSGACVGVGDPEMMYLSPIEQGINSIAFYRNNLENINVNVLTLIGSSDDEPHICEDASCNTLTWDYQYPVPCMPEKMVYVKFWPTARPTQVRVWGDSTFTAITYGLGSVESYGYNAGTLVNDLVSQHGDPVLPDPSDSLGTPSPFTCNNTPTRLTSILTDKLIADSMQWIVSHIPGVSPNTPTTIGLNASGVYNPPLQHVTTTTGGAYLYTCPTQYAFAQPGKYKVAVKWYWNKLEGCEKFRVDSQEVWVKPAPKLGFTWLPKDICPNSNVQFIADTTEPGSGRAIHFYWNSNPYGIHQDSTYNIANFTYINSGVDTVKLKILGGNHCYADTALPVVINQSPTVQVVADSLNTCFGGNVSINIQSPGVGYTYNVYSDSTAGSLIVSNSGITPLVVTNVTKDTIVYVEAISDKGCSSVIRKAVKIVLYQIPSPSSDTVTVCIGTNATLNVKNADANTTYAWYSSATGGSVLGAGLSYSFNNVPNDTVVYVQPTFNSCSGARVPYKIIAATPPALTVVSNTITVCKNENATFAIQAPDPSVTYNWYTTATGGTATTGTTYTINNAQQTDSFWLSATSSFGCTTSPRLKVILTVVDIPVVTVAKDVDTICSGTTGTITITNPIAGATYTVYDAPNAGNVVGAPSDGTTPFTFSNVTAATSYYVEVKLNATGCTSVRKLVQINVTAIPVAVATPTSVTACNDSSATFNVQSPDPNGTYTWYNVATGGTALQTGNTFTVSPVTANATYYLEAKVASCVSATRAAVNVVVTYPPVISVVSNAVSACSGDAATFAIQSPDPSVTYNWFTTATGGTATSGTSYTINPATTSGSYWVSATSALGCPSLRTKVDLTVISLPVVTVAKDVDTICSGTTGTITITNPIAGATYTVYDAPNAGNVIGAASDGTTPFTFSNVTAATTYYVEVKLNATGCTSVRKLVQINVTAIPVAVATPTSVTACNDSSATFNVQSPDPNGTYTWYNVATGGTPLQTGNSFTVSPVNANATYYLEAKVASCVSAIRAAVNVVVTYPPVINVVSNAVSACSGDAATFAIQSPDPSVTYNWYTTATGGTATSGTSYIINPATTSGSYWVSATSALGCPSLRTKVDLTVKVRPVVTIVSPDSVTLCPGLTQTFCVLNPLAGATYSWYNQSSGGVFQKDSTCFTTPPLVQGDTTYYVDGAKDGCVSITRATVKIKALTVLTKTTVTGTTVETNFITFTWLPVTNAAGYSISVSINGQTPTVHPVSASTLSYTINGLQPGDSAWAIVTALGVNACQNSIADTATGKTVANITYYPNMFTPNNDGKNDEIVICGSSIKTIQYAVYNQWGEKLWETRSLIPAPGLAHCYKLWDGKQRGVLQPVGVYMYVSKIVYLDDTVEEKKGTINLIR